MAPVMTASAAPDRMQGVQRAGKSRFRQTNASGSASSSSASRGVHSAPNGKSGSAQTHAQSTNRNSAFGSGHGHEAGPALSAHQQRLQQNALLSGRHHLTVGADENSITDLSPRSQKWIEDVHPLLEFFNYSKRDVYALVQRAEYDQDRVQQAVAEIVEEKKGHEQGSWEVVLTKQQKHQLRAAQTETQTPTGRGEGRNRRGAERSGRNANGNASRYRGASGTAGTNLASDSGADARAGRRTEGRASASPGQRRRRDSRAEAGGARRGGAGAPNASGKFSTDRRRGRGDQAAATSPGVERDWEVEALESQWGAGPDGLVPPKTSVRSGESEGTSAGSPVARQSVPAAQGKDEAAASSSSEARTAAAPAPSTRSWAARLVQKKEPAATEAKAASPQGPAHLGDVEGTRGSDSRKREPSPIAAPETKSPRATPVRDRSPQPAKDAKREALPIPSAHVETSEAEATAQSAQAGEASPVATPAATPVLRVSPAPEEPTSEKAGEQSRSPRAGDEPAKREDVASRGVGAVASSPVVIMPQNRHAAGAGGVFLSDGALASSSTRVQSPGAIGRGPHGGMVVVGGARPVMSPQSPRAGQVRAGAETSPLGYGGRGEAFEAGRAAGQDALTSRDGGASVEENLLTFGTVELRFCTANRSVAASVSSAEKPKAGGAAFTQEPSPKLAYPAGVASPRQQSPFPSASGSREQASTFPSVSSRFGPSGGAPLEAQGMHAPGAGTRDSERSQRQNEEALPSGGARANEPVAAGHSSFARGQGASFASQHNQSQGAFQGGRGSSSYAMGGAQSHPPSSSRGNYQMGPDESGPEAGRGASADAQHSHRNLSGVQPAHQPLLVSGDNAEFQSSHGASDAGALDAYYHYVGGRDFVGGSAKLEGTASLAAGAGAAGASSASGRYHQSGEQAQGSSSLEGEGASQMPSFSSPSNLYPNASLFANSAPSGPSETSAPGAPHQAVGSGRDARGSAGERRKKQSSYHLSAQNSQHASGFYGSGAGNAGLHGQTASWSGSAHPHGGAGLGGLGSGLGGSGVNAQNAMGSSGFNDLIGNAGSGSHSLNRNHAYEYNAVGNLPAGSSLATAKPPPPPPPAASASGSLSETNRLLGLGQPGNANSQSGNASGFSSYSSHVHQRESGQSSNARSYGQHSGAKGSALHMGTSSGATAASSSSHAAHSEAAGSSHASSSAFTPPPGLAPAVSATAQSTGGSQQPSASSPPTGSNSGPPSSYTYQGYHHTGMAYPHYNNMYYNHHGNMMPHHFGVMAGHHAATSNTSASSAMGNPTSGNVSSDAVPYSASSQPSGSASSLSSSSLNATSNALDLETSNASESHGSGPSSSGFAQQHFHGSEAGAGAFSGGGYGHAQSSNKTLGSAPSSNTSGSYMSYYNGSSSGFSSSLARNAQSNYGQNQQGGSSNSGGFNSRNNENANLGVLASSNQSGGGYGKNSGGYGSKQYHGHSSYYPRGNASSEQAAQAAAAAGYYGGYSYGQYAHPPGLGNTFYQSNFANQSGSSQGRPNYGGYGNANMWS